MTDLERVRELIGAFAALEGLGIKGEALRQGALSALDAHLEEDAARNLIGEYVEFGTLARFAELEHELTELRGTESALRRALAEEKAAFVAARDELTELREAVREMLKDHGPATECEDDCPAHRLRQLIEEKP